MKKPIEILRAQSVSQAAWHRYTDSQTGKEISAIGLVQHIRFYRCVRLKRMIIHRALPAKLKLWAWDDARQQWEPAFDREGARPAMGK